MPAFLEPVQREEGHCNISELYLHYKPKEQALAEPESAASTHASGASNLGIYRGIYGHILMQQTHVGL